MLLEMGATPEAMQRIMDQTQTGQPDLLDNQPVGARNNAIDRVPMQGPRPFYQNPKGNPRISSQVPTVPKGRY